MFGGLGIEGWTVFHKDMKGALARPRDNTVRGKWQASFSRENVSMREARWANDGRFAG